MRTTTTEKRAPVAPTGCCPPFDPRGWDDKEIVWRDKMFLKEHVHSFFHVPIDMRRKMLRATAKIDAAHAAAAVPLMLSDETSLWGADLYIDVAHAVPGAVMTTLSGTFITRVFDGPFGDAPRWIAATKAHVAAKGRALRKIYLAYTTCPACAKSYGHNYVIVFAEVEPKAQARPN